jgi:hypothetical protein
MVANIVTAGGLVDILKTDSTRGAVCHERSSNMIAVPLGPERSYAPEGGRLVNASP